MEISWDRVRAIFRNPNPPSEVTEVQFDWENEKLCKLAQSHWTEIDFQDLYYYYADLAYSFLQPELFDYLFPVCLMDWHESLQKSEDCSHGSFDFHYGVRHGRVFEKMVVDKQLVEIVEFFRDSFLVRLDAEADCDGSKYAYWLYRLNSLARVIDDIETVWVPWWRMETPGRAIAVLQYASGLIYRENENPITPDGLLPWYLECDALIYEAGWNVPNTGFLSRTLSIEYIRDKIAEASVILQGHATYAEVAGRMRNELDDRGEILEQRVIELPGILAAPKPPEWWPWW
jgi:hypothetical protein